MFRPRQNPPLDGTVPLSLLLPGNQRTPEYEPRITGMFLCSRQLLCRFRMWCASQRTVGTLVDAYVGRIASESSLVELGRVSFDSLGKSHSLQVNHAPNVHTPISHVLTPPPCRSPAGGVTPGPAVQDAGVCWTRRGGGWSADPTPS